MKEGCIKAFVQKKLCEKVDGKGSGNMIYTCTYPSPLGNILLAADEVGLTGLWFERQKYFANTLPKETISQETPVLIQAKK